MIQDAIAGRAPLRYPDYPAPIDWTYVDDAVEILLRALDCPLQGFAAHNAVGDRRSMHDAIAHVRARFPGVVTEARAVAMPDSAWDLHNDGLAGRIGAWPVTRLEQGIDRMIAAAGIRMETT